MHLEAHAGAGWLLAQAAPGDRRVRAATLLAAVAPDLDVVSYLFGPNAYVAWHHVACHNLLFSLLVSGLAAWWCAGARFKALLLTQAAFYTHFFGDLFFTVYPLQYFWPFSSLEFGLEGSVYLGHWLNTLFVYVALVSVVVLGVVFKRTPLEVVWPALDERVMNAFFRRRTLQCATCGRKTNERCGVCGAPVCNRHAKLTRGLAVRCQACSEKGMQTD